MNAAKLVVEISHAMPDRVEYLERRADLSGLSAEDRAAVNRALAERRAYFASPEWTAKLVRAI